MSNPYYNVTGTPATQSAGASAPMRTEFAAIAAGFALLPTLSGNANCAVIVNGSGTALTTTVGGLALAGNLTTTGAFNTTLAQQASVTLTLPAVTGTLATLAGTESLSNKTVVSPTLSGTVTGPDSATWTSGGIASLAKLGIGMAPSHAVDITQSQNAASVISLLNANAGGAAQSYAQFGNGTAATQIGQLGTNFTASGIFAANSGYVASSGNLILTTFGSNPIQFGIGQGEVGRFDTSGRLLVGLTADAGGGEALQVSGNALIKGNGALTVVNTGTSGGMVNFGSSSNQIYSTSAGLFVAGTGSTLDVSIQAAGLTPGYTAVGVPTGTQSVRLGGAGASGSLATNATSGFPFLPSVAGTPTGSASGGSSYIPIVIDTSAGKIWVRYGGAWHYATLT